MGRAANWCGEGCALRDGQTATAGGAHDGQDKSAWAGASCGRGKQMAEDGRGAAGGSKRR